MQHPPQSRGEVLLPIEHRPGGNLDPKRTDGSDRALTTNQGVTIAQNQDSLKAGLRGPALLEDFILREKLTHFDHERIPERVVHARGSGAHGYFESYASHAALTRASLFAEAGKREGRPATPADRAVIESGLQAQGVLEESA